MVGEQAAHGLPHRGEGRVGDGGLDRCLVQELLVLEPEEQEGGGTTGSSIHGLIYNISYDINYCI